MDQVVAQKRTSETSSKRLTLPKEKAPLICSEKGFKDNLTIGTLLRNKYMVSNNNENVNTSDDNINELTSWEEQETFPLKQSAKELIDLYGWDLDLQCALNEENFEKLPEANKALIRELREFKQKYSVLNYGGKTFVCWKDSKDGLVFQHFNDFKTYNASSWHDIETEDARGKAVIKRNYVTKLWLESRDIKKYENIVFDPKDESDKFYNLWKGFKVQPKAGNIKPLLKLVDALSNDEKECAEYLLNYLAHAIQKPWEKPEVCVVMRGRQGIGKGSLMKLLGRIFGNYIHLSSTSSLVGQFSGHLMDAYVVFADEAVWGGDKVAEGRLKAMITEPVISIESKGKDIIQVASYHRLFVASNEDWAVPVGEGDRRYFVLDCSDRYKGTTGPGGFFHQFNQWMDQGGVEAVFDYLLNRDISQFNPREFPKTAARVELQMKSLSPSYQFIYEVLCGNDILSENTILDKSPLRFSRNSLYKDFLTWCQVQQKKHPPSLEDFGKAVAKCFNFKEDKPNWRTAWTKKVSGKNVYFYEFNGRSEAMDHFAKNLLQSSASQVFFNYHSVLEEKREEKETPFDNQD